MRTRRILVAVSLLVIAVAVQTTVFADFRPLDAAPALVVLVLVSVCRHLAPIPGLLIGFGTGVLLDLLSESPLGLWAMVATTVAFVTVRLRDRTEDDPTFLGIGVFVVTLGALAMYAVLGTIFGEKTLADTAIVRKMLLPSLYNTVLAVLALPFASWLLSGATTRAGWDL